MPIKKGRRSRGASGPPFSGSSHSSSTTSTQSYSWIQPNVLCWWRFRPKARYLPGRVVQIDQELYWGLMDPQWHSQLLERKAAEPGYIVIHSLDDLKYTVSCVRVTEPLPFPAGNHQAQLEKQLGKSLGARMALRRAYLILELLEQPSDMQTPGEESNKALAQFLEIACRENLRATEPILEHILQVDAQTILKKGTTLPDNWERDMDNSTQLNPAKFPSISVSDSSAANVDTEKFESSPSLLKKRNRAPKASHSSLKAGVSPHKESAGARGNWIRLFKRILITRTQLLELLQCIPLDLLWNPTSFFHPLPEMIPIALQYDVVKQHSVMSAYHLLCANVFLHLLSKLIAVRVIDPNEMNSSSGSRNVHPSQRVHENGNSVEDPSSSSMEFDYSLLLSIGHMYGRYYTLSDIYCSSWLGLKANISELTECTPTVQEACSQIAEIFENSDDQFNQQPNSHLSIEIETSNDMTDDKVTVKMQEQEKKEDQCKNTSESFKSQMSCETQTKVSPSYCHDEMCTSNILSNPENKSSEAATMKKSELLDFSSLYAYDSIHPTDMSSIDNLYYNFLEDDVNEMQPPEQKYNLCILGVKIHRRMPSIFRVGLDRVSDSIPKLKELDKAFVSFSESIDFDTLELRNKIFLRVKGIHKDMKKLIWVQRFSNTLASPIDKNLLIDTWKHVLHRLKSCNKLLGKNIATPKHY